MCVSLLIQACLSWMSSSRIQGPGLASDWAVQERWSNSPRLSARHCLIWNFYCYGCSGAHQQDGADHPGKLSTIYKNGLYLLQMPSWGIRQCVVYWVCHLQAAAETAYDMVSPVPDERDTKRIKRFTHYGLAHQPVDLREGVAKAYTVVKEV